MTQYSPTLRSIERAIHFMADRIADDQAPDLDAIADAAALSKYHLHRVYALATGETINKTVTRLRLARGIERLRSEAASITEAAFDAGYQSSQAFAKALKRETGQTPSELRDNDERLAETLKTIASPTSAEVQQTMPAIQVELVSLEPFEVILKRTESVYPSLHSSYEHLFSVAGNAIERLRGIVGLAFGDIGSPDGLTFDCGLVFDGALPDENGGVEHGALTGGHYLRARHTGAYDGLPETLNAIYRVVLASDDYRLCHAPVLMHYLDSPDETEESQLRTDVHVLVKMGGTNE